MKCSECGSMNFESVGYEDGGGDYGDGFTEVWRCSDCGATTYGDTVYSVDDLLVNIMQDDSPAGFEDGEIGEVGIQDDDMGIDDDVTNGFAQWLGSELKTDRNHYFD